MQALLTAILYFGSFLVLGWVAKRALDKWTAQHGETLSEVQSQAGESGKRGESFLLGVWRKIG